MRRTLLTPTAVATAALALLVSACGDEVTDPDGLLESAEAEAVMRSAAALPSLGALIDGAAPVDPADHATLLRARELWARGSDAADPRSRTRRRLAVRQAAPVLARAVPVEHWSDVRERTHAWIRTVDAMLQHLSLPEVDIRVEAARRHLQAADANPATDAGAYHLLLSASELVETTPRFVAQRLSAQAGAAVTRAQERAPVNADDRGLERAVRLNDWAAEAVAEEDYLLAIQRAYYALQLVAGRGTDDRSD